jgi:hypothetical protein
MEDTQLQPIDNNQNNQNTQIIRRGDSFDSAISPSQGQQVQNVPVNPAGGEDILVQIMSNPEGFVNALGMTEEQAKNLRALLAGGATALSVKYLGDALSEPIAGAIGGLLGGYLSSKVVKKKQRQVNYNYGNRQMDRPENDYFGGI